MPRCSEVRQRESRLRRAACRKASTAQFHPTPASRGIVGRFRAVELLSSGRPTLDLFCSKAVQRDGLPKAGFEKILPVDGAFYLYADVARFCDDSFPFHNRMLEEELLPSTPGVDFALL